MTWVDAVFAGALLAIAWAVRSSIIRGRGLSSIDTALEGAAAAPGPSSEPSGLRRWLSVAGFRGPSAPERFVAAQTSAVLLGLAAAWLFVRSGAVERMSDLLSVVPGAAGEFFIAAAQMGPWICLAIVACIPWLRVRSARRERIAQLEKDLPLTLDLFATLAEAGLGFDAALLRILGSQPAPRALATEFQTYQQEALAGVPRAQALRRLAKRAELPAVTSFVSAVVEAEQIGASLAETLRHQAEDVRDRRRARSMLSAQALPVKLVFPLVLCFLPGIFASTLAPALYQMIRVVDSVIPTR